MFKINYGIYCLYSLLLLKEFYLLVFNYKALVELLDAKVFKINLNDVF